MFKGLCTLHTALQNALRVAVVNVVGDLLLFLGKITVAATCGVIAFAMSTLPMYTDPSEHPDTYIGRCAGGRADMPDASDDGLAVLTHPLFPVSPARFCVSPRSPVLPVALAIITGFFVAEVFFAVYEMAIDTMILSYCEVRARRRRPPPGRRPSPPSVQRQPANGWLPPACWFRVVTSHALGLANGGLDGQWAGGGEGARPAHVGGTALTCCECRTARAMAGSPGARRSCCWR